MAQTLISSDGQTLVYRIEDAIQAGTKNYTVELPPGAYRLGLSISCELDAANASIQAFPFVDKGQIQVAAGLVLMPTGTGTPSLTPALPQNRGGVHYHLMPNYSGTGVPVGDFVILLPFGLRITTGIGGVTLGRPLKIDVIAQRLDKVAVIPTVA